MKNHNIYAIVLNEEIVNMIVAENIFIAQEQAKDYDIEKAFAVECTDYPCSIGDYYIGGFFYYKDKITEIKNNSIENQLANVNNSHKELNKEYSNILFSQEGTEKNISNLLKGIQEIETALCELSILVASLKIKEVTE